LGDDERLKKEDGMRKGDEEVVLDWDVGMVW
jgi:hypothetical protein